MRKTTLAMSPLLLLFCMGSTDCEAYTLVTVPQLDFSAPETYDGVWQDGAYVELGAHTVDITHHLALGESVLAIGSGLDNQSGIRKVVMSAEQSWLCCDVQNTVCSVTQSLMAPITDVRRGVVGSTVSTGMWVGTEVSLDPAPTCQAGYYLKSYTFKWTTTVTNFLGASRTSPPRRIVYP
jgi:hypothetical protein